MEKVYTMKNNCSGCTACRSICPKNAIKMEVDVEGFSYPKINQDMCINCGLCVSVCAFKEGYRIKENMIEPDVYAVKHKSDSVRMSSTSGGMFTAISDYVLDKGGVVYGAAFDNEFNVIHLKASSKDTRDKFKGSKYVQSDLRDTFLNIKCDLMNGKFVMFSGTPCQTAGLSSFLNNMDTSKLYLCDIVCHGTPSPLIWREYFNFIIRKFNRRIEKFWFRYKADGWRGSNIGVLFKDGSSISNTPLLQLYNRIFYSSLVTRPSCHECKFANMTRPSDITIGDFWGIEKCIPNFEDNMGISLVLVNSLKGQHIFDSIKETIYYIKSNSNDCMQKNLKEPSEINPMREAFWKDYQNGGFTKVVSKYFYFGTSGRIRRKVENVKIKINRIVKK